MVLFFTLSLSPDNVEWRYKKKKQSRKTASNNPENKYTCSILRKQQNLTENFGTDLIALHD